MNGYITNTADADRNRMAHFHALDHEQQAEAVRRLAVLGYSDHDIGHATGLAVEQVRQIIGRRQEQRP